MEYNYVVFGSAAEYYKFGYSELNNASPNTAYYSEPCIAVGIVGSLLRSIRKIHMTPRINQYINLPGKKIWNKQLYQNYFNNDKPICFIFFSSGPFTDHVPYGFIDYLKQNYPDSKYVVFYQDLVCSNKRNVSLESFKNIMDLVISFDYGDCERYGLLYHPLVYSNIANQVKNNNFSSDIYFCGAAKNRLKDILEAYNWFYGNGFVCDFHIITNNADDEKLCQNKEGIKVCKSFPYYENLQHVLGCKYILEIMQKGGTGYTIRACEAIVFNKKMISNNHFLQRADFYNDKDIIIFDTVKELKKDILIDVDDCNLGKFQSSISPIEFVKFIEGYL